MKKIFLFIITLIYSSFAQENLNIYEKALKLEGEGNYKEAMKLYKQIAKENLSNEDKYLIDIKKNTQDNQVESFTNMKKSFYQKQIDKINDKETDESIKQLTVGDFREAFLKLRHDFGQSQHSQLAPC